MDVYREALNNAHLSQTWTNFQYLVENLPNFTDKFVFDGKYDISYDVVVNYWKWQQEIKSCDKDKVMEAIKGDGFLLLFVDKLFQKDKDLVMAAAKKSGLALQFADESLRKDKDIVMTAVKNCGIALQFADESLRKDKDIVMTAVQQYTGPSALQYADESLRNDKQVVSVF